MTLDPIRCYEALAARDSRFDGAFFVAVSSTGIYCRPVCTARTPGRDRCTFHRSAAEAERAGFRACFRCRPELAPGLTPLESVPRLVTAAVRRIEEGYLNEHSVDELGRQLGVTGRHLRRALEAEIGVTPVELAQSRRLALAKRLLQDTDVGLSEVAFASGFGSVRRFNALFRARFARTPSSVRRGHGSQERGGELVLRFDYRPPLAWTSLLEFLRARAIPAIEEVKDGEYRRTVRFGDRAAAITVSHASGRPSLIARVPSALSAALLPIAARLRALFDLDSQPMAIDAWLSRDPLLASLVKRRPGLRVPGAFDPFEAAVRAVLGQQITVRAATTLARRVVERFGVEIPEAHGALTHTFPTPDVIARATVDQVASLGIVGARARSLIALAGNLTDGTLRLDGHAPTDESLAALEALPGIGPWTAHYIAMRALRWPDAFPSSDVAIRKALGGVTARQAERIAEVWRPWRSHAVLHLWASLNDS